MTERENYREWARSVRSEARQGIRSLRAERLARRDSLTGAGPAALPPSVEELPLSISSKAASLTERASLPPVAEGEPMVPAQDEPFPSEVLGDTGADEPQDSTSGQECADDFLDLLAELPPPEVPDPDTSTELTLGQGTTQDSLDEPEAQEATAELALQTVPDTPGRQTEASLEPLEQSFKLPEAADPEFTPLRGIGPSELEWQEDALRDSSLAALPGVGIGLIWLLHVNGVSSLQDLAQADAETLGKALGLVGRLVNVQDWIDFAATHLAADAS
jgi:predicted flap endonuclease-1-like 5' DNA nuclease